MSVNDQNHRHEKRYVLFLTVSIPGSQSELIALLQKQLNEKEEEIKQIAESKLIYKRPIKQRFEEVFFFCYFKYFEFEYKLMNKFCN